MGNVVGKEAVDVVGGESPEISQVKEETCDVLDSDGCRDKCVQLCSACIWWV